MYMSLFPRDLPRRTNAIDVISPSGTPRWTPYLCISAVSWTHMKRNRVCCPYYVVSLCAKAKSRNWRLIRRLLPAIRPRLLRLLLGLLWRCGRRVTKALHSVLRRVAKSTDYRARRVSRLTRRASVANRGAIFASPTVLLASARRRPTLSAAGLRVIWTTKKRPAPNN